MTREAMRVAERKTDEMHVETPLGQVRWTDHAICQVRRRYPDLSIADLPNPVVLIRSVQFFGREAVRVRCNGGACLIVRWDEVQQAAIVLTIHEGVGNGSVAAQSKAANKVAKYASKRARVRRMRREHGEWAD